MSAIASPARITTCPTATNDRLAGNFRSSLVWLRKPAGHSAQSSAPGPGVRLARYPCFRPAWPGDGDLTSACMHQTRRVALYGREGILQQFALALGPAPVVLLTGDSGVGK